MAQQQDQQRQPQDFAEQIARVALHHYQHVLPNKGKPKKDTTTTATTVSGGRGGRCRRFCRCEWTVYAAIVATTLSSSSSSSSPTPPTTATTTAATTSATAAASSSSLRQPPWVVSCATGTKCTAVVVLPKDDDACAPTTAQQKQDHSWDYSASILHDSHAEVLCRRGLLRVLIQEMQRKVLATKKQEPQIDSCNKKHDLLETTCSSSSSSSSASTCFRLRPDVQLHLYISDSPCGDASIYALSTAAAAAVQHNNKDDDDTVIEKDHDQKATITAVTTTFTGSKIIVSRGEQHPAAEAEAAAAAQQGYQCQPLPTANCTTINSIAGSTTDGTNSNSLLMVVAREPTTQRLAALRTKSGRSNLEASRRSTSMSCSDKLVRWAVLGLQGAVIRSSSSAAGSFCIPYPIRLTSCIVSRDPRTIAVVSSTDTTTTNDSNQEKTHNSSQLQALQRAIPNRVSSVHAALMRLCSSELDAGSRGSGGKVEETTSITNLWSNVAIKEFAQHLSTSIPTVFVVDAIFPQSKAVMENEKLKSTLDSSSSPSSCTNATTTTTSETNSSSRMTNKNARKRKHNDNIEDDPPSPPPPANANAKKSSSSTIVSFSPTGLCINWNCADDDVEKNAGVELTVGARGTRHGKKPQTARDYSRLESRLCRNQIRLLLSNVSSSSSSSGLPTRLPSSQKSSSSPSPPQQQAHSTRHDGEDNDDANAQSALSSSKSCYKTWKRSRVSPSHYHIRQHIFQQGPLNGWLVGGEPLVLTRSRHYECCQPQQQQQEPPPPLHDDEK
jgi:Adenosine-deaminase (editase) domain